MRPIWAFGVNVFHADIGVAPLKHYHFDGASGGGRGVFHADIGVAPLKPGTAGT